MPIETSMYDLKNMANPAEDYDKAYKGSIDRQEKAMSLKSLAMEQKAKEQGFQDQQAIRKASRENVDQFGQFNSQNAIAQVSKQNPMAAMQMQKMVNQYGIDGAAQHAERAQQFFANTTPENYAEQREKMIKSGFEEFQKLPDVYIPSVIQRGLVGSSSAAQQMSMLQAQAQREMEIRKVQIEQGIMPNGGSYDQYGIPKAADPVPGIMPTNFKGKVGALPPEAQGLGPGAVIPAGKRDMKAQEMANDQLSKSAAGQDYTTAKNNLLAVKNAQSLVNEAADPNEITNLMLPLLAVESAKLAAGKAPTAEEMSHMLPQNRLTAMAKSISYLTGQPEAANQGEFVEQLNKYLEDLKKNSVENIKAYHQSALDAGIRAGMSPKTAEAFKASKARELRDLSETRKNESKSSGISQQDKQAIEWAKKNPGPQADAILKANGVKK
jgi:hypothetical protein